MTATQEIGWIDNDAALERLVAVLATTSIAAVDTEFVREKTYYPQLCLIQIGTGEQVACVDCLAKLDLEPLYARLFDPSFTWVLHSARQDLEVIFQRAGRMPPRLIDTQVAAAFTGYPPQIGLEGLLKRELGVELGESFARTDWSRRPLPDAAVALRARRRPLLASRVATGRCRARPPRSARVAARGLRTHARRAARRRHDGRMVAPERRARVAVRIAVRGARARTLARSRCAAERRPRRWLLADEVLIEIAAALPRDADALDAVAQSKFIARSAPAVLAALAACTAPELQAEVRANAAGVAPDKATVKSLQERVRQRAAVLGVEPEILATRRDLVGVALGNPPPHLRSGWRAKELASVIEGPLPATAAAAECRRSVSGSYFRPRADLRRE